jgi:hypothetical protein
VWSLGAWSFAVEETWLWRLPSPSYLRPAQGWSQDDSEPT